MAFSTSLRAIFCLLLQVSFLSNRSLGLDASSLSTTPVNDFEAHVVHRQLMSKKSYKYDHHYGKVEHDDDYYNYYYYDDYKYYATGKGKGKGKGKGMSSMKKMSKKYQNGKGKGYHYHQYYYYPTYKRE